MKEALKEIIKGLEIQITALDIEVRYLNVIKLGGGDMAELEKELVNHARTKEALIKKLEIARNFK